MTQTNETIKNINYHQGAKIGTFHSYEVWVCEGVLETTRLPFALFLYNQESHLVSHEPKHLYSFRLQSNNSGQVGAILNIKTDPGTGEAISLPQAPFGGVQLQTDTPGEAIQYLLQCVENWCRARGLREICIKAAPSFYDQKQIDTARDAYLACGFSESGRINYHIPVSTSLFQECVSPAEKRRLKKAINAGLLGSVWTNPNPDEVYDFLLESRTAQGYRLTISLPQLRHLLTHLPDAATVFTVRDGSTIACLTVAIRASKEVLYNFCPADTMDYRPFSPTVLLNATLYTYARKEGIRFIDLGTSLDHFGNKKPSLIRFKEGLGGVPSPKITYRKILQ